MRLPNTPSLPAHYRVRADLVAFVIGTLHCGLQPGIAILLLIVGLAAAAGVASIWKINGGAAEGVQVIHLVRASARAGVLTALLGAAMTALTARRTRRVSETRLR
jgi:hypothetical protein